LQDSTEGTAKELDSRRKSSSLREVGRWSACWRFHADDCLAGSAKYAKLLEYRRGVVVGHPAPRRAVVFSRRDVATLDWLHAAKSTKGLKLKTTKGSRSFSRWPLSDAQRRAAGGESRLQAIVIGEFRLLVTGDVASRGCVNLHSAVSRTHPAFRHSVGLIRIEQRSSRIDPLRPGKRPQRCDDAAEPVQCSSPQKMCVCSSACSTVSGGTHGAPATSPPTSWVEVRCGREKRSEALAAGRDADDVIPPSSWRFIGRK
jgi:hypothetical protein